MEELQIEDFDPCTSIYVNAYLNDPEVQKALHANITRLNYSWSSCRCDAVAPFHAWNYSCSCCDIIIIMESESIILHSHWKSPAIEIGDEVSFLGQVVAEDGVSFCGQGYPSSPFLSTAIH